MDGQHQLCRIIVLEDDFLALPLHSKEFAYGCRFFPLFNNPST